MRVALLAALLLLPAFVPPAAAAPVLPLDARGIALGPTTQNLARIVVDDVCNDSAVATLYLDLHYQLYPVAITRDPDPCAGAVGPFQLTITNANAGVALQGAGNLLLLNDLDAVLTGTYFGKVWAVVDN